MSEITLRDLERHLRLGKNIGFRGLFSPAAPTTTAERCCGVWGCWDLCAVVKESHSQ